MTGLVARPVPAACRGHSGRHSQPGEDDLLQEDPRHEGRGDQEYRYPVVHVAFRSVLLPEYTSWRDGGATRAIHDVPLRLRTSFSREHLSPPRHQEGRRKGEGERRKRCLDQVDQRSRRSRDQVDQRTCLCGESVLSAAAPRHALRHRVSAIGWRCYNPPKPAGTRTGRSQGPWRS